MTKRKRRLFFWIAVAIFVLVAPLIISYAGGYRYDFQKNEITQTGAIVIDSKPEKAKIILNEKELKKETPGAIKGLFPSRNYEVSLQKDGYQSWQKVLSVEPEKIVSLDNIFLFPKELSPRPIIENRRLSFFSISPEEKLVLFIDEAEQINIFKKEENTIIPIEFNDFIKTTSLDNVLWSKNLLVFSRKTKIGNFWYLFNTSQKRLVNLTSLYERDLILRTSSTKPLSSIFNPEEVKFIEEDKTLLFRNGENIISLNIEDRKMNLILDEAPIAIEVEDNNFFTVDKKLKLKKYNLEGSILEEWPNLKFTPKKMRISPDGKKMLYFHNYAVGVLWFKDVKGGEERKKGETDLIFQSPKLIKNVWWHYSSEYLIVNNSELMSVEIDGRGGVYNKAKWLKKDIIQIIYNSDKKSIWLLKKDGTLWRHLEKY